MINNEKKCLIFYTILYNWDFNNIDTKQKYTSIPYISCYITKGYCRPMQFTYLLFYN